MIYNEDCLDTMSRMKPESIDMIFADPPYNTPKKSIKTTGTRSYSKHKKSLGGGSFTSIREEWNEIPYYSRFSLEWISRSLKLLRGGGTIYICGSQHNLFHILKTARICKLDIHNIIVWQKPDAMPNITHRTFSHSTEFIIYGTKGKNWTFNYEDLKKINPDHQKDGKLKQMRDVWSIPKCRGKERIKGVDGKSAHPTQKPEELVRRCIIASTNPGDTILDPFLGSGTTAAVAEQLDREWIGIEKDKEYYDIAIKRINDVYAQKRLA